MWVGGPDPALPGGGRVCIRPAGRMLTRIALRASLVSRAMAEALRAFADVVVGRRRLKA